LTAQSRITLLTLFVNQLHAQTSITYQLLNLFLSSSHSKLCCYDAATDQRSKTAYHFLFQSCIYFENFIMALSVEQKHYTKVATMQ